MNNVKTIIATALIMLVPAVATADEFDITMDVVGAEENFDEVIVNRITLPFKQSASDSMDVAPKGEDDERLIDRMEDAIDEAMPSSSLGTDFTIESLGESRILRKLPLN